MLIFEGEGPVNKNIFISQTAHFLVITDLGIR